MADYLSYYRTNYFHVTDEDAYQKLMKGVRAEDYSDFCEPLSKDVRINYMFENNFPVFCCDETGNFIQVSAETVDNYHVAYKKESRSGFDTYTKIASDGDEKGLLHGFGGTGIFEWVDPDLPENEDGDFAESDIDEFYHRLQKLLPDNECFIYQEIGHEKLRYLVGYGVVVTKNDIKSTNISDWCAKTAKEILGNNCTDKNIICEY